MKNTLFGNERAFFVLSLIALFAIVIDFGYPDNYWDHLLTDIYYLFYGIIGVGYLFSISPPLTTLRQLKGTHIVLLISLVLSFIALANTVNFLVFNSTKLNLATTVFVFLVSMFEISGRIYAYEKQTLHPALVFGLSFVILILMGTLMLMLPNATVNGIGFVDALFTSTSAVCVTGLVVLDTGKDFTIIGQIILLVLIQFGAMGMLSFTSLFGLMFKGFGSYQNRLNLKNMINAETLEDTFKTLIQIIFFVFFVEMLGAFFIYQTLDPSLGSPSSRAFFALFHSISAFCNAGFSTLTNSIYEEGFRYNYSLHIVLALLIILGGIGYGVIINVYQYFKKSIKNHFYRQFKTLFGNRVKLKPNLSLNTKIVVITSSVLIVVGALMFYLLEKENSLAEHSQKGKIITAMFGSITSRTAGFNTVDTGTLTMPTIMIILFLMWVGASPGSTGGGIKTTTFAVATLNIIQQVVGLRFIRVGWKMVQQSALQRATSIISLSLIMVGLSTFLLTIFDSELGIQALAFEVFSAYSTVGLSMGITALLSTESKIVIIFTMFIGRVGFLTLLTGFVRQAYVFRPAPVDYPEEEIFIN